MFDLLTSICQRLGEAVAERGLRERGLEQERYLPSRQAALLEILPEDLLVLSPLPLSLLLVLFPFPSSRYLVLFPFPPSLSVLYPSLLLRPSLPPSVRPSLPALQLITLARTHKSSRWGDDKPVDCCRARCWWRRAALTWAR